VVLVPNPAYPIHAFGFILAGAAIRHVPATSPETYLSALSRADSSTWASTNVRVPDDTSLLTISSTPTCSRIPGDCLSPPSGLSVI